VSERPDAAPAPRAPADAAAAVSIGLAPRLAVGLAVGLAIALAVALAAWAGPALQVAARPSATASAAEAGAPATGSAAASTPAAGSAAASTPAAGSAAASSSPMGAAPVGAPANGASSSRSPSAGGAAARTAPARAAPAELCRALAACIDGAALCVLVQVPPGQRARVLGSEAYADMESRLGALRSRHPDVRLVVQPHDLARTLGGVKAAAELRTLWVAAQGRALLMPGLYVDDTTPVEQYFSGPRLPEVLEGYAQPLVVQRRPGAC